MQDVQQIKSTGTIQLDKAEKDLAPTEVTYKLNYESGVNNKGTGAGGNATKGTPLAANRLIFIVLPGGINTTIATHESIKTAETYVFFHNSNGNHGIYRIDHITLQTVMVLLDPDLNFSIWPRHTPRVHLYYNNNSFVETANKIFRKYLTWTDGLNWQGFLDVETSIATNSFNVPYFACEDRKQLWQLPTRPSLRCVQASWITPDPEEKSLENRMNDITFQYRIRYDYYDGRPTSYGPISTTNLLQTSPCQATAVGLARCQKLILDAGGPQVEKIIFLFANCAGNVTDDQQPIWYQADVIEKYNRCIDSDQPFYERTIREDLNYNAEENTFEYIFCNTKSCIAVGRIETDRNFIPCPITSYCMAQLDDRLMLINNRKGYDPIPCESTDKLHFTVEEPVVVDCKVEMTTVKFRIILHNPYRALNQFIFEYENLLNDGIDEHVQYYGGLGPRATTTAFDDPGPYNQVFADIKDPGFLVYVEGTPYYGITKQYKILPNGDKVRHRVGNMGEGYIRRRISRELRDGDYIVVQDGEVKVPKGTAGYLRIAAPNVSRTSNYQQSSTNVLGIVRDMGTYSTADFNALTHTMVDYYTRELEFYTCNGPVDLTDTPFMIVDLTGPFNFPNQFQGGAVTGYLTDKDGRPVEGANCVPFNMHNAYYHSLMTDHNGYFFYSTLVHKTFKYSPTSQVLGALVYTYTEGLIFEVEKAGCAKMEGARAYFPSGVRKAEALEKNPVVTIENYNQDYYAVVKVLVEDVDGVPIPGISVALEGRKARQTASDGIATILVRNNTNTYGTAMNLRYMVMQNGLCYLTQGNCQPCMPFGDIAFPACFDDLPVIEINNLVPFNRIATSRGLRPGIYPAAVKYIDAAGRESFAQGDFEIVLPSFQEKGGLYYSIVKWQITGLMQLPSWVAKMAILIADNRQDDLVVSFAPDKVEFTDSVGNPATSLSAEKVKISIKSLLDYYNANPVTSNVRYNFQAGDKLQIIADQDGNLLDDSVDRLTFTIEAEENNLNTPEPAPIAGQPVVPVERFQRLVISYRDEMKDLKAGFLYQILRPRICENSDAYFEVCDLITVKNGEPVTKSGTISTFNSYFVRRNIVFDDRVNSFTFPFIHHSPSDNWGDHCIDRGRVSFKNPYEKGINFGRNAMISDVWLENGNLNGLSNFRSTLSKDFPGELRGDAVMAISREGVIMVISEYDFFILKVGDDFARVGADGILRALSPDAIISGAQSKIFGNYGCQYDDVGAVVAGEGYVAWVDTRLGAFVMSDYNSARDAAQGKVSSYFGKKLQHKFKFNRTAQHPIKITMGIDPLNGYLMLTFFSRGQQADIDNYVHNRREIVYEKNETIVYSPADEAFTSMASFTPEYYGVINNGGTGKLFLTFNNGQPWVHREFGINKYNLFYNRPVDQVIEFVINKHPNKLKQVLAMEMQSTAPYYADRVIATDGENEQFSVILPVYVKKSGPGKYNANFMADQNSPGGLYDGRLLSGYTFKVRLVRDNTVNNILASGNSLKQTSYSELDNVLVKFKFAESSGFGSTGPDSQ